MVRLGNSVLALGAQASSVADAIRIRDALDPLLIEDALWHGSPADIAGLHQHVTEMKDAVDGADPVAFVHANWRLHAAIAAISPNALLSSLYIHLLDLIESHTLSVLPTGDQPLGEYIAQRYAFAPVSRRRAGAPRPGGGTTSHPRTPHLPAGRR